MKKQMTTAEATGEFEVVMFDTPGVLAIGPYEPRQEYRVSREEAQRLCEAKGFKRVLSPAMQSIQEREE